VEVAVGAAVPLAAGAAAAASLAADEAAAADASADAGAAEAAAAAELSAAALLAVLLAEGVQPVTARPAIAASTASDPNVVRAEGIEGVMPRLRWWLGA
jgi:hypothetical protein